MLFILALFLSSARRTEHSSQDLTSTGILQILWLLGNDHRFKSIPKPDNQMLREAGMFEVDMDVIARGEMNRCLNDYEIEVTELTKLNTIRFTVDETC